LYYLNKTHLETLKFERWSFNDAGMQALTKFPLRTLKLAFCPAITSAGWALLSQLTHLENLDVSGCDQLTDDDLRNLVNLPLRTVNLSGCTKITDRGLLVLEGLGLHS